MRSTTMCLLAEASMSAIDFNVVGQPDPLQSTPLNVELNARIERAVAAASALPRQYLGASILGHECARQVQFDWWCLPELPARVRLIFDRGHFFETLIRAQLAQAGFVFAPDAALEFTALDGCLRGHADGVIIAGPKIPGVYLPTPCVWEAKAVNAKNFRAVARNGFAETFPRYAIQVALYERFLDKTNPAVVTCVNADTCEVLHLALPMTPSAPSRRSSAPRRSSPRPAPASFCRAPMRTRRIGAVGSAPISAVVGGRRERPGGKALRV
jgi:hypothetical protein